MTTITIPRPEELQDRLTGVDRLLTAKKWERAAIVFAYTGIGGPRNSPQPLPPKLNIRQFAAQGFAGLTTNKAVERYRAAWVSAIDNGWAPPVEPGQTIELPNQPFPAWPYGASDELPDQPSSAWPYGASDGDGEPEAEREDAAPRVAAEHGRQRRSLEQRVFERLDQVTVTLRHFTSVLTDEPLPDPVRDQLRERLTELQRQTEEALRALDHREPAMA